MSKHYAGVEIFIPSTLSLVRDKNKLIYVIHIKYAAVLGKIRNYIWDKNSNAKIQEHCGEKALDHQNLNFTFCIWKTLVTLNLAEFCFSNNCTRRSLKQPGKYLKEPENKSKIWLTIVNDYF